MITHDEIVKTTSIKDTLIAYVYDGKSKNHDDFVHKMSCNAAEFSVTHLRILGKNSTVATSLARALSTAKINGFKYLLYVEVGNIVDWDDGIAKSINDFLDENKNLKFAGHILDYKNGSFYIHPQFFIVDVTWALKNRIRTIASEEPNVDWTGSCLDRSEENFHDDYTPKEVWPVTGTHQYKGRGRGWNIIDKLAETGSELKPWPKNIREQKTFLYPSVKSVSLKNKGFLLSSLNTTRVYVANTEDITQSPEEYLKEKIEHCIVPASGPNTFLIPYRMQASKTLIYDVSDPALEFISFCKEHWDGKNYKEFINDNFLNRPYTSLYKNKREEALDRSDEIIKSLGNEFVDWWSENKKNFRIEKIDLLDHFTWYKFKRHVQNEQTLFNISNVFHYAPTSIYFSLEERVKILQDLQNYLNTYVDDGKLQWKGMNPIDGSWYDGRINEKHFKRICKSWPWRKD